ncbi:MAG: minor capsid protein [Nocardioides alkalitolerans]
MSHVEEVARAIEAAAAAAVVEVAEDALTEASDDVPVDQGDLRRAGEVLAVSDECAAIVAYDIPYAARQHEDTTLNHPRGGEAGWLRKTFERNEQRYVDHIANAIRSATS